METIRQLPEPPRFEPYRPPPKRRRWLRWLLYAVGVSALTGAGLIAIFLYETNQIVSEFHSGDKQQVIDSVRPELGKEPRNQFPGLREAKTYLLVGSDARPGETSSRSDTTMLVRIYPKQKAVSILSIPRDLWVPIPGYGEDRINAAYAYGRAPLLIATLREWLGVKIDHFFQVDFSSFAGVVDEIGGVYLPIDQDYYHYNDGQAENNWASIDIDHGYQRLSGEDALAFVRFRHLDSDFLRAARQQLFIREVGRQLRGKTDLDNIGEIRQLVKVIAEGTTSDIDTREAINLAMTMKDVGAERIARFVMPGEGTSINGASVLLVSDDEKNDVVRAWDNPEKLFSKQRNKPRPPVSSQSETALLLLAGAVTKELGADRFAEIFGSLAELKSSKQEVDSARKKKKNIFQFSPVAPPGRLLSQSPFKHCIPESLPSGFSWPELAVRQYKLNGKLSLSAYATQSSGVSLTWMWTPWFAAPILDAPNDAVKINGRTYQIYWEGETIRMISWLDSGRAAWITNTLANQLTSEEMIELAVGCK